MNKFEKHRKVVEANEKTANSNTLFIDGLNKQEVEYLRNKIPYQGTDIRISPFFEGYVVTTTGHLAIAISELMKMRKVRKVKVKNVENGFSLTSKRK